MLESVMIAGISEFELDRKLKIEMNDPEKIIVDIERPKKELNFYWALLTFRRRCDDMFYRLREENRIDAKELFLLGSKKERIVGITVTIDYDRIFMMNRTDIIPGKEEISYGSNQVIEFDKLMKLSYCNKSKKLKIARAKVFDEPFKINGYNKIVMKRNKETLVPISKKQFLDLLSEHGEKFESSTHLETNFEIIELS